MNKNFKGLSFYNIGAIVVFFIVNSTTQLVIAQELTLLEQNNLVAWEVAPKDGKQRSPEQRAQMLKRLGFQHYAYLSSTDPLGERKEMNTSHYDVDAEIKAMQKYGINIMAWYFWFNTDNPEDDPIIKETFESFKRHNIKPQIWVTHSYAKQDFPQNYSSRVKYEAERIAAMVKFAAIYGCKVHIYNHRSWLGVIENQLAVVGYLKKMGINDVGLVYNFSHCRFDGNDDTQNFPQLWERMKSHVVAVNIAGLPEKGGLTYMSQGVYELPMMRVIQGSGWEGPVGLFLIGKHKDEEESLRQALVGVDWMKKELKQPGSGGSRPVLEVD